jgi:hypothetical protein
MSTELPSVLFRCWSETSAGGLRSRKSLNGVRQHNFTAAGLLQEFQEHKDLYSRTPTAFVSTTSNFLRALHIAYQKIYDGENTQDIKIAFLTSRTDTQTRIYPAKNFAIESGSSEEEIRLFENEYVFLWKVPEDNMIHVVSMDIVIQRGFTLPEIHTGQPVPSLANLRKAIVDQADQLTPFERGYLCGSAACMFGIRAPVHEIAFQMSRWARRGTYCCAGWELVDQAFKEAIQDRTITVAEDLEDQGEIDYLMFELSCLEDTHDEISIEIGWDLQSCRHAETPENLLVSENWKILGHRQGIARRIATVYQSAGW